MRRLLATSLSVVVVLAFAGGGWAQESGSAGGSLSLSGSEKGVSAGAEAGAEAGSESEAAAGPAAGEAEGGEAAASGDQTVNTAEVDAGTYSVRLRDLEQRVNELKEQIFRSKARLALLAETVLRGVVAGGQARIVHQDKMGSSYRLVKVVYALDGAPIFNKADEEGGLGGGDGFDIYNGSIVPGEHTLTVQLEYRGHGYGIFSYLKGYRFKVSSSYTFTAPEGKLTTLKVVGFEKGGPTAPLEERPAVSFVERVDTPDSPEASQDSGEGGE
ncbi:MAG: hypothetical protein OEZ06_21015 [Myxococcales bacterium]|nr:hypothetical protein [Myxococcales bacterium]